METFDEEKRKRDEKRVIESMVKLNAQTIKFSQAGNRKIMSKSSH